MGWLSSGWPTGCWLLAQVRRRLPGSPGKKDEGRAASRPRIRVAAGWNWRFQETGWRWISGGANSQRAANNLRFINLKGDVESSSLSVALVLRQSSWIIAMRETHQEGRSRGFDGSGPCCGHLAALRLELARAHSRPTVAAAHNPTMPWELAQNFHSNQTSQLQHNTPAQH